MRALVYWGCGAAAACFIAVIGASHFIDAVSGNGSKVNNSRETSQKIPSGAASMPWSFQPNTGDAVGVSVSQTALLPPRDSIDWSQLPRGLGSSLAEAKESNNGNLAFVVAQVLERCLTISTEMDAHRENAGRVSDPDVRRALTDQFAEKQRVFSQCQTVQGDMRSTRLEMLSLASRQGVVGAASRLLVSGQDSDFIRRSVLADAKVGELISLALVAGGDPHKYSVDPASQRIFQATLVAAAESAELQDVAGSALLLARQWATYQMATAAPSEANLTLARQVWEGKSAGVEFNTTQLEKNGNGNEIAAQLLEAIRRRYQTDNLSNK